MGFHVGNTCRTLAICQHVDSDHLLLVPNRNASSVSLESQYPCVVDLCWRFFPEFTLCLIVECPPSVRLRESSSLPQPLQVTLRHLLRTRSSAWHRSPNKSRMQPFCQVMLISAQALMNGCALVQDCCDSHRLLRLIVFDELIPITTLTRQHLLKAFLETIQCKYIFSGCTSR